jgi:hypothetical protein
LLRIIGLLHPRLFRHIPLLLFATQWHQPSRYLADGTRFLRVSSVRFGSTGCRSNTRWLAKSAGFLLERYNKPIGLSSGSGSRCVNNRRFLTSPYFSTKQDYAGD